MELSEEMRYRLCYLTLPLALDQKLERDWGKKDCDGVLAFLDLMSGSHLAEEQSAAPAAERRYVSQRPKLGPSETSKVPSAARTRTIWPRSDRRRS